MSTLLSSFTWEELRHRTSAKWRAYAPDVLPMWVAEMDTPLAPAIEEALVSALHRGDTGYADAGALPEAFASYARRSYGWRPEPEPMRLVPDVMRGVVEVVELVTAPGDRVVVHTPAYPPFFSWMRRIGRTVVESPLARGSDGYEVDLDRLERDLASGAEVLLLCNPHNPTGRVFTHEELHHIADLAERHQVRVLVDEIHAPLTFPEARHVPFAMLNSPAAADSVTFVSASKAWNLAGLKAALAVPGSAAQPVVAEIGVEVSMGAGLPGVLASTAAFEHGQGWLDQLRGELDANRRLLGDLLARHLPEVRYDLPQATYLAWLDCRELGLGDDPAAVFHERGRVALSPGPGFGAPGTGFARLNLATAPERITEAVRRMVAAV
ncbi:aminotransferase class I/II-fold pyridoxal phosphate-dependent enzyme [Lipingzhangella sp. LS1_29]|uniref:cysteine-S-conjugate beta-lyase n=1 Tax=Lipingzhangella rawalii TaxID=2055835 RepID=A0ABU2H4D5_9ACTN|nr:aminotransferase class I/II-fold pyridoxal phosphate-dependent enzyme [Lipingzhangella rawalii]MDS1269715.1 aminotransferase class I/II-fold pyridoxal phosphate-dependent enzyme [Lipingzhangella rawalii]